MTTVVLRSCSWTGGQTPEDVDVNANSVLAVSGWDSCQTLENRDHKQRGVTPQGTALGQLARPLQGLLLWYVRWSRAMVFGTQGCARS